MIVVSDMMGTLTTGSPVIGLVDWVRNNQSKTQAQLYMLSIAPAYFLAKRGIIDWQKWGQTLMINSLKMIRNASPEKMKGRKLFITARDDRNDAGPRLPSIREQYDRAPNPKELVILEGSAHGQLIFDTPGGEQLMRELLRFLSDE